MMNIKKLIYINLLRKTFLPNIMRSKHKKRALLVYLVDAFQMDRTTKEFRVHTNRWRNIAIAECLDELGYVVDVLDYKSIKEAAKIKEHYDLIFGMGEAFDYLLVHSPQNFQKKIYFATGSYWEFQNSQEQKRVDEVNKKYGSSIKPNRVTQNDDKMWKNLTSLVYLGAEQGKTTYQKAYKGKIYLVNNNAYDEIDYFSPEKDYKKVRNNFVYLSGKGMVLNGLDLFLEIFAKHPEWNLNIYGEVNYEKDFEELFYDKLYNTPNIHVLGWLDWYSDEARLMIDSNVAVVNAIASGASHGSVVVAMSHGLIPIVSTYTNIEGLNCGIQFESLTTSEIERRLLEFTKHDINWYKEESRKAYELTRSNFSQQYFKRRFKEIISEID